MKKGLLFLLVNFVITVASVNAATFVVSATSDNDNGQPYNTPSTAENTLRKCVRLANASAGPHTINFAIPAGPYQINVTNGTYQINTSQITIDATSQTGWSPVQNPIVILKGNGGGTCFQLNGTGSNTLLGFVVQSFQHGVEINSGSNSNTIANCWFGVAASGNSTAGTTLTENGVTIRSNLNIIGSAAIFDVTKRNIFSGCRTGIRIENGSSNTISNNYIGTDLTGTVALSNTEYGVYVTGGSASSNSIGSVTNIPSNLLSGNRISGIYFEAASISNSVIGNYIGTDLSGTSALANGNSEPQNNHGIYVNNTQSIIIDRNLISGNIGLGIYLNASPGNSSDNARIHGNYIGTDASGMNRIANLAGGIRIDNSSNHIIGFDGLAGSNVSEQRNVISGNGGATHAVNGPPTTYDMNNQCGIYLFAKDNNVRNVNISGNYIGVNASGTDTLGNKASGVKMEAANWTAFTCDLNVIGGSDWRFRNVIGGNGFNSIQVAHGILLKERNATGNTITSNFIGIGADGESPVGNRQDGISFLGAQNNSIGGAGVENVIGNNQWGIFLQSNFGGVQSSGNTIAGNFIGTDSTGLSSVSGGGVELGNGRRVIDTDGGGIGVQHGSTLNILGNAAAYNVLAGNLNGILFRNSGFGGPVSSNIVQNNLVGVGKDGTTAIPNLNSGITISGGATGNAIGAASVTLRNIIAYNGNHGIELDSAQTNTILGNYIGLDKNAGSAPNSSDGINIHNGSSRNIIGGISGDGNWIGNNVGNGIGFSNPNAAGSILNAINNNSIFCNGGRGIVLNGGNASYAAPTFSGTPSSFTVTGPAGSWIELYSLDGCNDCSIAANTKLQGKTLVASGASPLNYTPTGGETNLDYTATASSDTPGSSPAYHNTSEFSVCQPLCITATTADAGATQNICNATTATLSGNVPSAGTGTWSVVSGTASITDPLANNTDVTGLDVNGTVTLRWSISTGAGCTASTDDVIINTSASPTVADAGSDIPVCGATIATLAGNIPTSGTGSWSVLLGTATITDPSANNSGVTGLAPNGTATLRWSISTSACSTPSTSDVIITTNTNPSAADAGSDIPVCESTIATLAGNTPTTGTGAWSLTAGAASITDPSSNTSGVTGLVANGSATLLWTISNGVCPTSSDEVIINSNTNPTLADAGSDNSICATNTTLSGNVPAVGTGLWSVVGISTATVTTPLDFNSGVTDLPVGVTTLRWTISNGVCPPSAEDVLITRDDVPSVSNAGIDNSICSASGTLSGNSPATGTGLWSIVGISTATITNPAQSNSGIENLPLGATTFRWTVSNGSCSDSESDVTITRDEFPTQAQATDFVTGICGTTATLTGNNPLVGSGVWSVLSPSTATVDNPAQTSSGISNLPVGLTKVVWTISNGSCIPSTDTIDVTRNIETPLATIVTGDRTICVGSIPVEANAVLGAGLSGQWTSDPSNVIFADDSQPNTTVNGFLNDTTQLYWTITGPCGSTSDSIFVALKTSNYTVSVSSEEDSLCVGSNTTINVSINGGTASAYTYTFTSSDNSFNSITTNSNVSVTPVSSGWTHYYISVIDSQNCQSLNIAEDSVYTLTQQSLIVPNLITPNQDGHNDCFIIKDTDGFDIYPGSVFNIYNRWGEPVHRDNNYKNGDFCGSILSDGIYFYHLETGCGKNELKGWLHIINNSEETSNK